MKGTTLGRLEAPYFMRPKGSRKKEKGVSEGEKIVLEISDLSGMERRPGPDLTLP